MGRKQLEISSVELEKNNFTENKINAHLIIEHISTVYRVLTKHNFSVAISKIYFFPPKFTKPVICFQISEFKWKVTKMYERC